MRWVDSEGVSVTSTLLVCFSSMSLCLFVCLFICQQVYTKTSEWELQRGRGQSPDRWMYLYEKWEMLLLEEHLMQSASY